MKLFVLLALVAMTRALTETEKKEFRNLDISETDDVITFTERIDDSMFPEGNKIKRQSLNVLKNPLSATRASCVPQVIGVSVEGQLMPNFNYDVTTFLKRNEELHKISVQDLVDDEVLGVAVDGFPIYSPKSSDLGLLTSDMLDECHGRCVNGTYRYHMTLDSPFNVGCLKGVVVKDIEDYLANVRCEYKVMCKTSRDAGICASAEVEMPQESLCQQALESRKRRSPHYGHGRGSRWGNSGRGNSRWGHSGRGSSGWGNNRWGNNRWGNSGWGNSGWGNSGWGNSGWGRSGWGNIGRGSGGIFYG